MQNFVQYLRYRLLELPVWLGIPLFGLFIAGKPVTWTRLMVFSIAILFSMIHVLLLNDWGDLQKNPYERLKIPMNINQAVLINWMGKISIVSYFICLVLFSFLGYPLVILAMIGGVLSLLYSHPAIHFKENLIGSTALHLIGGEIQFLLGYIVFGASVQKGILIGLFFSLIFAAGHFVHMCLDVNEDKKGNVQTWATRFNIFSILVTALIVFFLAHLYLFMLTLYTIIPVSMFYIFLLPITIHLYFCKNLFQKRITEKKIYTYRLGYRLIYAICTISYILYLIRHPLTI